MIADRLHNKAIGLLFILLLPLCVSSQRYYSRSYTELDGLSSSKVFSITQDSSGLIWFATRSGISSYDGLIFTNYNINNGLTNLSYSFILTDEKSRLWGLPSEGLLKPSLFKDKHWVSDIAPYPVNQSYVYSAFEVFYKENKLNIVCGTQEDGMFLYQNGKWDHLTTRNGLPSNNIYSIKRYEGALFIATEKGLIIYNNGIFSFFPSPFLENHKILALAVEPAVSPSKKSKLWILTENLAGYIQDSKLKVTLTDVHFPEIDPGWDCFIFPVHSVGLYYGSPFYIIHYSIPDKKKVLLDHSSGLVADGATEIFIDRETNTWISGFRGVTKISSKRFSNFTSTNGLFDDEVASGIEWSPGKYAFGHFGAISILEKGKFSSLILIPSQEKRKNNYRILDLCKDREGNLWAAVPSEGLAKIRKNKKITWYHEKEGIKKNTNSVICTSNGVIYAATYLDLMVFRKGQFAPVTLSKKPVNASIRKLFAGKDNSIYVATLSSGLIELKDGRETVYMSDDNKLANNLFSFCIDSHHRKWVGTAAGLFMAVKGKLIKPEIAQLLFYKPVYLILEDYKGNLWFGTDNGLYCWNGKDLNHYTVKNGLSGQEINRSAGFSDSKHQLWFGTNNGLTLYQPEFEYDLRDIPPPVVELLYVKAGRDSLNPNLKKVLAHDHNYLEFNIRITSLIDESEVYYKYNLEGIDQAWSDEQHYFSGKIVFSNLKPGTYRFCLMARNAIGVWSNPVCSASFTVLPPFWFRWWFLISVFILVLFVILITLRSVLVSRYNTRLENTVAERTRELKESELKLTQSNAAKDKFFSIIAHDLKSPFNALLGMLDILTTEPHKFTDSERKTVLLELKKSAIRTFSLLENLLTWSRAQKGIIPFSPKNIDIISLIQDTIALSAMSASNKHISITHQWDGPLEVLADADMIQTVLRNLLSNALKFTGNGGNVSISAFKQNGRALVSMQDSGKGIPPQMIDRLFKIDDLIITKGTENETGTGLGLILCKDFIERNHGSIWVESEPGKGSTFYFTLPLTTSYSVS
ncbi:MAG: ATP-binding protein [Bacteroidetes bacterium]|nr:ATP-binding protein [Bacteroidota bacterium]